MNQHVSPDTAIRLRAAGFPQPAPEYGQRWYFLEDADNCSVITVFEGTYFPEGLLNKYVFASTAIDIFAALKNPQNYKLTFDGATWHIQHFAGFSAYHENPAEAVALMFLPVEK